MIEICWWGPDSTILGKDPAWDIVWQVYNSLWKLLPQFKCIENPERLTVCAVFKREWMTKD